VANGGRLVTPHLVDRGRPAGTGELPIPDGLLTPVREGLSMVVNGAQGTAHWSAHSDLVEIAGKTGTVQVVGRDSYAGGKRPAELENHAWFVSFAPADRPELVVVVFVEHGASGSGGAAPIARALYEEYFARHSDPPVAG
jgi:penicillin-binding protein 2